MFNPGSKLWHLRMVPSESENDGIPVHEEDHIACDAHTRRHTKTRQVAQIMILGRQKSGNAVLSHNGASTADPFLAQTVDVDPLLPICAARPER